ncbi:MAG TPA: ZIP family metal transporter [Candidatus Paceibacterota bacterium]
MQISFGPIFLASIIGSVCAMVGGVFLLINERFARRLSIHLLSFAAGALLGAAFFELLPEALASEFTVQSIFGSVVSGILIFFIFERLLNFYHVHNEEPLDANQNFGMTVIVSDTLHNFIDGIAIAFSFLISIPTGIVTTTAVFFHEVPQEISDFSILLHQGYSRRNIIKYNLFSALATPVGALVGYLMRNTIAVYVPLLLAFAAGSFIYISISDLLPELKHKAGPREFSHILVILAGLATIAGIGIIMPE